MLLLTGGTGTRMGCPKHDLRHPSGASWSSHLITTFLSVFPDGPVQILGEAIADHPDLPLVDDPRQGPAKALRHWAKALAPEVQVWWVVGCDQVRWLEADLRSWAALAQATDPHSLFWVCSRAEGHLQPLGGWLPHALRPALAQSRGHSLVALVEALPHRIVTSHFPGWRDVDTPEERDAFEREEA